MILIVGGLGIISTMNMNIIERKREIGILRAIGVTSKSLFKSLTYEGFVIGVISWDIVSRYINPGKLLFGQQVL